MKVLHFDCFAGISGDMALGAFVDIGGDPDELRLELEKLGVGGWKLDFVREERNGITGTRALVDLDAAIVTIITTGTSTATGIMSTSTAAMPITPGRRSAALSKNRGYGKGLRNGLWIFSSALPQPNPGYTASRWRT